MKKLNNKGMSLVELIVSFAIVTVAVVYFSQSLIITSKLFKSTKEETDEYVEEVYVRRVLEAMFEEYYESSTRKNENEVPSKTMGIAGNKSLGFDTIFINCNNDKKDPSEFNSIFDLDSNAQKGAFKLGNLTIKKTYPRNIQNGYLGQKENVIEKIFGNALDNLKQECIDARNNSISEPTKWYDAVGWAKYLNWKNTIKRCDEQFPGGLEQSPSEEYVEKEEYSNSIDKLTDVGVSEFKRHPGIISGTFDWQHVGGQTCDVFNNVGTSINTDAGVSSANFEKGDYWIPIEYYDYFKDVNRDFDASKTLSKWHIFKKNDAKNLGFDSINNYYNPSIQLFVSVGKYKGKIYKYHRHFSYEDFLSKDKRITYFLYYQLGENDVITEEENKEFENTVRLKTYCVGTPDCNKSFEDSQ